MHINVNGFLVKAGYHTIVIRVFIIRVKNVNVVSTVQFIRYGLLSIGAIIY